MSHILVCGAPVPVRPVVASLKGLDVRIRRGSWPLGSADRALRGAAALVLVRDRVGKALLDSMVRHARDRGTGLVPVFVVLPGGIRKGEVRRLYESGASAVFEWPRERPGFARSLILMAGVGLRGRPSPPDQALARAVEARLEAEGIPPGRRIRVVILNGIAFLTGQVDALWKLRAIEEVVAATPGVEGVMSRRLFVVGPPPWDAGLARRVRSVLRDSGEVDLSTVAVAVEDGRVILTGTARDAREVRRLMELAGYVRGVRGIEDRTLVSPRRKAGEAAAARRIDRALRVRFPRRSLEAAFFGGVAVLRGTLPSLHDTMEAERLVLRQEGVARVVNKVRIRE